ncbi:MAG: NAD(P)-dependent alcohol dehydrogenase [Chloroflexi bacterium]|nr:NAD(P)-dependent alcohol dehydrogenase [Chloroflexota bacterium]
MRAYIGLKKPTRITILGMELAGEIEDVGRTVTRFQKGDQVFAATGFVGMGACAEYICLPEDSEAGALALRPANMTWEEAAAVPMGGLEALSFVRQGDIQSGQKVLINGGGGTIGTYAIQLAKYFGAEVTAVDSAGKLDMLRSLGADHTIDYTQEDFTTNGQKYDVVFDVVGKTPISRGMRSLSDNGIYLMANPRVSKMIGARWASRRTKKTIVSGATFSARDLVFLKGLIEAGELKTVIDRRYPLEQTAEAHRYVETGQKAGNVVITVGHETA